MKLGLHSNYALLLMLLSAGGALVSAGMSSGTALLEWEILTSSSVPLCIPLCLDPMSLMFFSTVVVISGSVLLFSTAYMAGETHFVRFHLLVIGFIASMIVLIFSPSVTMLILGWDGLGVSSFLLVIFYQHHKALSAGMLTILVNRLGDGFLILGVATWASGASWDLWAPGDSEEVSVSVWLMALAACTKSAQLPFSAWLPAAMAAPTPVSCLVHSSTLVTAGVYILLRAYSSGPMTFLVIGGLGAMTSLMASASALNEGDLKKIIALSTLSQLGVMCFSLSAGGSEVAFMHLLFHAFIKALLFMTIGGIIHVSSDYQDCFMVSSCPTNVKSTLGFCIVASGSLLGAPFTTGFFSKEVILEASLTTASGVCFYLIYLLSLTLTLIYTVRMIMVMLSPSLKTNLVSSQEEGSNLFIGSYVLLGGLSVAGGSALFELGPFFFLPSVLPLEVKNLYWGFFVTVLAFLAIMKDNSKGLSATSLVSPSLWGISKASSPVMVSGAISLSAKAGQAEFSWNESLLLNLGNPPTLMSGAGLSKDLSVTLTLAAIATLTWIVVF